ncbi:hypothetical protein FRC17_009392 [Serendipita sp. 399]|nr:hypothetical protein FRC17_009392 [Serendipita sp. 399]
MCGYIEDIKKELRYSILSHRWSDREVLFHHFQMLHEQSVGSQDLPETTEKIEILRKYASSDSPSEPDLHKLINFLDVSTHKQCSYAWVDTVCINKESSTELEESIRSMYAWYRDSHICIVHLSETSRHSDLGRDPWFTRGWTLQELLAPRRVAFYSKDWEQITRSDCTKRAVKGANQVEEESEKFMWSEVARITGIEIEDLHNFKPGLYDIRKRMTWASSRKTTRIEDMAYCLVGIFDVDLSVAYGEKEKAFYRLQVEILQNCDDMSLFDWQGQASIHSSMLAVSPACFARHLGLHTDNSLRVSGDSICAQTNVGIRMPLVVHQLDRQSLQRSWGLPDAAIAFSILGVSSNPRYRVIMILGMGDRPGQYVRLALVEKEMDLDSREQAPEVVFIK